MRAHGGDGFGMEGKPLVVPAPFDGSAGADKPAQAAAQLDPAAFADAHRQMLGDASIQFDLPDYQPPQVPNVSMHLGPALEVIFWLVVAGIVLALLYLIISKASGWSWRRRPPAGDAAAADASWRPDAAEARELLGEADALAGEGRYGEAARLILHRSIEDIDDKRPDLVRPALTSRDICALDAIPPSPRSAFARIAMFVERSLFAGRSLHAGDWADCRAAYEEFAFADAWRG
jgi:hypothetical protein